MSDALALIPDLFFLLFFFSFCLSESESDEESELYESDNSDSAELLGKFESYVLLLLLKISADAELPFTSVSEFTELSEETWSAKSNFLNSF